MTDISVRIMEHIGKVGLTSNPTSARKSENVDLDKALAHRFAPNKQSYTEKEVALYALAIGAAAVDPIDPKELQFVYENSPTFRALPTMGVCFPFAVLGQVMSTPGLTFNPMMLLQYENEYSFHILVGSNIWRFAGLFQSVAPSPVQPRSLVFTTREKELWLYWML